ncbi:hypothetical protein K469DRAFT_746793 [Zopfia rhizophila CBS 207.26]|uniref:Rhodopsin domain-containing protein n=1 Tax=Zopfia rhizophila CBS 207.26 TaxID=1314779 RepID=A0A6A6EHD1_9PEZI|nr:hypothetical protein K469DRAFT_746793 [Zopfia rhizophila CBS 207.26]
MSSDFPKIFARETWSLYGVGVFSVAMRMLSRIQRLRLKGLETDDYLMLSALVWYTLLCVSLNQVASGGGSNLMTEEDIANLTPETKAERIRGSKWVFVSEHAMVLTIWTLKVCMLIIYSRITNGLKQRKLVMACAVYTALGFVGTELALFLSCRPLSQYWAVPTDNYQCSSYQHYEIANGVFSITSDIAIMLVAMPLLIAVRLPLRQKLILLGIFGLGIFVIIAAFLTKIYCLVPSLISYVYMNWYFREATVGMLVVNLPLTWHLLRTAFPSLRSWFGHSLPSRSRGYTKSSTAEVYGVRSKGRTSEYPMHSMNNKNDVETSLSSSQEAINKSVGDIAEPPMQIRQDITVTVEHSKAGLSSI